MLAGPSPPMSSNVIPNDSQGGNLMVSNGHLMTIWIPDCHKIAKLEKSRFWGESLFGRKYGNYHVILMSQRWAHTILFHQVPATPGLPIY